jgi:hypothetical protein
VHPQNATSSNDVLETIKEFGDVEPRGGLFYLGHPLANAIRFTRPVLAEGLLDLRKQVVIQDLRDLDPLLVHDPVYAEVQVFAVELLVEKSS